jgi:hypothetical protein
MILAHPFPAPDAAYSVDVTRDEMAAQIPICAEWSFEIDQTARLRELQISAAPGLLQ